MQQRETVPLCWWCGGIADSQEHRVKQSRVRQILSSSKESSNEPVQIFRNGELHDIRGPKAKIVKFARTMCANCNNSRSQLYDRAYTDFIDYVLANTWRFEKEPFLRWAEIYVQKPYDQRHLARYFIKNFACRAVEQGVVIPRDWIDFMDSITVKPTFDLVLFSDYRLIRAMDGAGLKHLDPNFAQIGSIPLFSKFNDAEGPKIIVGEIMDGAVGVYFEWRNTHRSGEGNLLRSISTESESVVLDRRFVPYPELHSFMDASTLRLEELNSCDSHGIG